MTCELWHGFISRVPSLKISFGILMKTEIKEYEIWFLTNSKTQQNKLLQDTNHDSSQVVSC